MSLSSLTDFIDSLLYSPTGIILQVIGGLLSVLFLYLLLRALLEVGKVALWVSEWTDTRTLAPSKAMPKTGELTKRWNQVKQRIASNDETQWKLAIIESDAILDTVIQDMGFHGETMGERLKGIEPGEFPMLNDAWRAHKVRNFIAHDVNYRLPRRTAEVAFNTYQRIFQELNIFP
jgi:hypothetical protein